MATFEGIYNSVLRGVSQQIPQEREDGQLSSQFNMLSDPVTGLRRRAGTKYHADLLNTTGDPYIRVVDIYGDYYIMCIDTVSGTLRLYDLTGTMVSSNVNVYYKTTRGKSSIRSVVSRNSCYIVNTEKVPKKQLSGTSTSFNPDYAGYFSIRQGAFSKLYTITIKWGSITKSFTHRADASDPDQANPTSIANWLRAAIVADSDVNNTFDVVLDGSTVALKAKAGKTPEPLTVETGDSSTYIMVSNTSRVAVRTDLLGNLPSLLDGYTMAVGTERNSSYYEFNDANNIWKEVGKWGAPYIIKDEPVYWTIDNTLPDKYVYKTLGIKMRSAGDDENNPLPKFIDYGITGIGTYQSRLILLAGPYVNLSKTTDFAEYSRTTVTELLDDDAIEVASASLSSAQFEYAIPYNKDLVLVSRTHQAVMPSNSTILTPKTAVIYPSNEVELSMAVEPAVVARSLYFGYQRGSEFFQIGEFIPNSYTDAQYLDQGLMDHLPLYAQGVCTHMAVSTTNNMVVFTSGTKEVLINQYRWQGDERVLLSFHKWVLPYEVIHASFIQDMLYLFMRNGSNPIIIGSLNVQLNQLDDKPTPYLDLHRFVEVVNGTTTVNFDTAGMLASVHSIKSLRHQKALFSVTGNTMKCAYDGTIAIGLPYTSSFALTPPFLRDQNGKVLTGAKSTVAGLRMSFKATSTFHIVVSDAMGVSYDNTYDTALTWSETDLGVATINDIGSVTIPCRTRMSSTECDISTASTTDLNVVTIEYIIRYQGKHRRL